MHSAVLSKAVSTAPTIQYYMSPEKVNGIYVVTKFSDSSFTLETGGTVVTDSLEELALNLSKEESFHR